MPGTGEPTYEELGAENSALRAQVVVLTDQVAVLTDKVAELEKKLSKDSSNSSLPPSSDRFNRPRPESPNRAARRALGRKPGKQPGDEGRHLAQVENPDEVVVHAPGCCEGCGADLADVEVSSTESRQVTDIPDPKLHTTEHRAQTKVCGCGRKTKAAFPPEARSYACYGPKIRSIALYLLAFQHLPFERCQVALRDLFGVEVSTGFLDELFTEGGDGLETFLAEILGHLMASDVVHSDETFDQVKKTRMFFHVACNELYTLICADETRGIAGTERLGLFPDFTGIAVHDRLAQYFRYDKATHAICCAHLVRDLASVAHRPCQRPWASEMTALLYEMNLAAHSAREARAKEIDPEVLAGFLSHYEAVATSALAANPDPGRTRNSIEAESYNLAVAFSTHKDAICRFACDLRVPFTNNQAEADIRMVKLHSKISGPFRNMAGAKRLAAVRSYLSTARKHDVRPFDVLVSLFAGRPWIPKRT